MPKPTASSVPAGTPTRDPKVLKKAFEVLSAGRYVARQKVPYFTPILLKLVMREDWDLSCKTMATSAQGIMRFSPDFVASLTPKQAAGCLVHEAMHLMLKSHERLGNRDPGAWNKATDRAINPGVIACGLELPKGCQMPKEIGKKDGLTADEYYVDEKGDDGGPSPCSGGACGGCAGNPIPEEANDAGDPSARSPGDMSRAAKETAEGMRDAAAKNPGSVPSDWARLVGEVLAPPTVPWQSKLARAVRAACAYRPGAVVHKYDAPSRRQAGIGFGYGKPVLPRYRAPVPEVYVAIDTSGSMGAEELAEGAAEIRGVLKALGAAVTFCSCDTEIHTQGRARRLADILGQLKGGGGTDFRPIFAAVAKARPRPEVLVFITDGYGPSPAAPPPGVHVIALLVGPSVQPLPFGENIRLGDDAAP